MSSVSEIIFVDESGDQSLSSKSISKNKYFVLGFVYCSSPIALRKELKTLLRRLHKNDHYPKKLAEIKFHLPTQKMYKKYGYDDEDVTHYRSFLHNNRLKMIKILNQTCSGVFAAICDKSRVDRNRISSGEHLSNFMFAESLSKYILPSLRCRHSPTVYYDDGRLSASKSFAFQLYLRDIDEYMHRMGLNTEFPLGSAIKCDSRKEPGIWASDVVAGAYSSTYFVDGCKYRHLLNNKINLGHRFYFIN